MGLVIRRHRGQCIQISSNIRITVAAIRCRQVKLYIEAPAEVKIMREELLQVAQVSQRVKEGDHGKQRKQAD